MQQAVTPTVTSMNNELVAAGHGLAGNDEVLFSVLSGCGDCIKILDLDGRLQFMSEGGKRVMEVEDFGKLKGCPWPDFWVGDGNKEASAAVAKAKAGGVARCKGAANTPKATLAIGMYKFRQFSMKLASQPICCRYRAISPRNGAQTPS
jgi:hypothetical protein